MQRFIYSMVHIADLEDPSKIISDCANYILTPEGAV